MAAAPQFLTLKDNRDDPGRVELIARRTLIGAIALLMLLGLLNVFGQEEVRSTAAGDAAVLVVTAPTDVRGGLMYQGRFTIEAREEIDSATLVLARGWSEGTHINTIEPAPVGESSRDGRLALDMGHVAAGKKLVLYVQFQVNPTNVGHRSQDVELYDGERLIARIDRDVTVWP